MSIDNFAFSGSAGLSTVFPTPAYCTLRVRHNSPYGHLLDLPQQPGQCQQVGDLEVCPPRPHHDHGVSSFDVCPAGRERTDTLVTRLFEEHPVLAPGMSKADHLEALAGQGMERVGY